MGRRLEAKMCSEEVKEMCARLGLGNIILMDEKMSKQFVRGCLRICIYGKSYIARNCGQE